MNYETRIITAGKLPCTHIQPKPGLSAKRSFPIVYFHGGGLLLGSRNDLPSIAIESLCDHGHDVLCLGYPLAPEYALSDIVREIALALLDLETVTFPELRTGPYAFFGRSSGAYLALLLAKHLEQDPRNNKQETLPHAPSAIICLYGYHDLRANFIHQPASRYTSVPHISRTDAMRCTLPAGTLITEGAPSTRFSLYAHARQTGTWNALIGIDHAHEAAWSLTDDDLRLLPPTYIAAANQDPEIPYETSEYLAAKIPSAHLFIAQANVHEFDNAESLDTRRLYKDIAVFLDAIEEDGPAQHDEQQQS